MAIKVDVIKDQYCLFFQYDAWLLCHEKGEWIGLLQSLVAAIAIIGAGALIRRQLRYTSMEANRTEKAKLLNLVGSGHSILNQLGAEIDALLKAASKVEVVDYLKQRYRPDAWQLLLDQLNGIELTAMGEWHLTHLAQQARLAGADALQRVRHANDRVAATPHTLSPVLDISALTRQHELVREAIAGFDAKKQRLEVVVELISDELNEFHISSTRRLKRALSGIDMRRYRKELHRKHLQFLMEDWRKPRI